MTTGNALVGMLVGVVGIGASVYLVRNKLLSAWTLPEESSPKLPWNPLHLGLIFLIFVLSSQVVGMLLRMIYGDVAWQDLGVLPTLSASMLVNVLVILGIWTLGVNLGAGADAYGLQRPPNRRHFTRGGLMYLACLPAIFGASFFWMGVLHLLGSKVEPQAVAELLQQSTPQERFGVFLLAAILVPIAEEFLFRGFLQTWLVKSQGALHGILIASVFFAILHGTSAFGPLMVIALAAGVIRHVTGSLWPAIAVHICNNSVSSILLFMGAAAPGS